MFLASLVVILPSETLLPLSFLTGASPYPSLCLTRYSLAVALVDAPLLHLSTPINQTPECSRGSPWPCTCFPSSVFQPFSLTRP